MCRQLLEPLFDHGPRDDLAGVLGTREHVQREQLGALGADFGCS